MTGRGPTQQLKEQTRSLAYRQGTAALAVGLEIERQETVLTNTAKRTLSAQRLGSDFPTSPGRAGLGRPQDSSETVKEEHQTRSEECVDLKALNAERSRGGLLDPLPPDLTSH
jgi:hypothetical protein